METLDFSHNWNNKLDCSAYTTIRLRNDSKYFVGAEFEVKLKKKEMHRATVVDIRNFTLDKINEFIARLDTGYSANECRDLIQTMYKKSNIDWSVQQISLILLEKHKENHADKIAIFCRAYKADSAGQKYTISPAETGMIKRVPVTEELAKVYFETKAWWNNVKSVTNYCKYINEIKKLAANGPVSKYPNSYDKVFESKLTDKERPQYWAHLRGKGWKPKHHPQLGHVIDWVPPEANNNATQ